jgi:Flp pilus assembly pilin Flp
MLPTPELPKLLALQASLRRFLQDESGASHIEYAIIAAFAGVGLISGLVALQRGLDGFFTDLSDILTNLL